MDRRAFLVRLAGVAGAAAVGPQLLRLGSARAAVVTASNPYGALGAADANGIQLPPGFTSRLIATSGQPVGTTGYSWHTAPDGGACFPVAAGGWIYVSNSETSGANGGGASAVRFAADGSVVAAYRILGSTSMNCAGGPTPWGTWLSCEENGAAGKVYECDPQQAGQGVVRPLLGSFNHEAAVVDPAAGHVYLTEDHASGRLYRFTPTDPGDLSAGALFAASVSGTQVTWLPTSTSAPDRSASTTAFNGGEGAWISGGTLWFTTKGDKRVWELDLATQQLTVLYDFAATTGSPLNAVDNITRHEPSGDLFVAEDGGNMEIGLITTAGTQDTVSAFLRIVGHASSEITGPAFSPDGTRLYLSSQRGSNGTTGRTYEITGPFRTGPPPPVEVLVPTGATWRYLDDGSDQGTAWRSRTFVDSAWKQGAAPLGYGDPMATTIGYGPDANAKHITTYFRRSFEATHGYQSMVLHLRRDDGAVVYVNGAHVKRSNMPAGTITSGTLASSAVGGAAETTYFELTMAPPMLYAGTNVIAVEVHQNEGASTDLGFDLSLQGIGNTGPLPPPPATTITLPITTDAHVRSDWYKAMNFGSATTLEVQKASVPDRTRVAYLRLDTSSVLGSITSAKVRVYCRNRDNPTPTTVQVLAVADTTWSESAITWQNAPAPSTVLDSFTVASTSYSWKEVDVTAYVRSERQAGRSAVSFALLEPSFGELVVIASREAAANRPELRLTQ